MSRRNFEIENVLISGTLGTFSPPLNIVDSGSGGGIWATTERDCINITRMEFGLCYDLIKYFPEIQFKPLNFILEIHRCHLSREGENKIDI